MVKKSSTVKKKHSKKTIAHKAKKANKSTHKSKKPAKKEEHVHADPYIKTGINGFDQLFDRGYGLPSGAAVLVEGGPGSGKTIFCLATVMGLCKQGKKCLYMSFEEPEDRLLDHMQHFGWDAEKYVKAGKLRIKRFDAIDVSRSVEALLSAAKKELLIEVDPVLFPEDFHPDLVVIDSLTSIASAFSGHESRFRIYMEQLFRFLEKNKITNLLIREVSSSLISLFLWTNFSNSSLLISKFLDIKTKA
jgi:circadian clock protein KaiC